MAEVNDFYVTVTSNGSTKYFPDNTVGSFSNHLAEPIRLSDYAGWEVGLTEITFPTVRNHVVFSRDDLICNVRMERSHNQGALSVVVRLRPFYDAVSFASMFKAAMKTSRLPNANLGIKVRVPYGKNLIMFELLPWFFVSFSEKVWKVLGLDSKLATVSKYMLGNPDKNVKAYGMVNSRAQCRSVWVYSNCCMYRIVSDVRVPLLRTVEIRDGETDVIHRVFTHPYYLPVSQSFLPSLEMYLRDNTGKPLDFFSGETVATLHFKRKGVVEV